MSVAYPTVRHRCEHCRRSYASVTAARRHEADCYRNPASKSCPSCAHYKSVDWEECAIGLAEYDERSHPDDWAPRHIWTKSCPAWTPKEDA